MCMILSGGKNTFPDLARVAGGSAGVQRLIYKWGHCNHTHSFFFLLSSRVHALTLFYNI